MEGQLPSSECLLYKSRNFSSLEEFHGYKISQQNDILDSMALGLPTLKLVIIVIGFLTNILNIVVLTWTRPVTTINVQCAVLEIVNLILFTTFFYEFPMFYDVNYVVWWSEIIGVFETISLSLNVVCVCASNWLTVSVAIWRLVAVTYPLQASVYLDWLKCKIVIVVIVLFSIVLWIYYFFSFDCHLFAYNIENGNSLVYEVIGNWRTAENGYYFRSYFPIAIVFSTVVPWTILFVLSFLLIWSLRNELKVRAGLIHKCNLLPKDLVKRASVHVTVYLSAMIVAYIFAYLPDCVISIMYFFYHQSFIQTLLICKLAWSRFGILLCNSLTICFYFGMCKRLRNSYVTIVTYPFKSLYAIVFRKRKGIVECVDFSNFIVTKVPSETWSQSCEEII